MFEHDEEDRFAAALRELTDLHEAASSLVASGAESERAFADGLRVGDVVRRAVRQGHRHRPDAGDVAAIESIAAHLRIVLSRALDSPEVERLRGAMAAGVASAISEAALSVFADLATAAPAPAWAYRGCRLRRRQGGFETMPSPAEVVREIDAQIRRPLLGGTGDAGAAQDPLGSLPSPLVLSPSFEACSSEVALRWSVAKLHAEPLRSLRSGDLWFFSPEAQVAPVVVVAEAADDEWWAASEVTFRDWSAELRHLLGAAGLEVADYSSSLPQ